MLKSILSSIIVSAASSGMIIIVGSGQDMPSCAAANPNTEIYPISTKKMVFLIYLRKEFINLPPGYYISA